VKLTTELLGALYMFTW